MIPIELSLTNFLSYRETTLLDFRGIHTACIAGANGAGKSSLLDAMTWSLFGQSRSKSDDDVVNRLAARAGEPAEVRFSFALEDSVYRVVRTKQQGRSVQVEFQLQTGDDTWRSLTEGRVRETQSAVETLLKMNYDTFINASFLLQGKADEFTTKTPNKRKEILADLIGVSRWNTYRDLANLRRREEELQLTILDARLEDIEHELAEEEARSETLSRLRAEQEVLSLRLSDKELLLEGARRQAADLKHLQEVVAGLGNNVARSRHLLTGHRETQARREKERDAHQVLLDRAETIEADHAAWQIWNDQCEAWQEKERAIRSIQEKLRPHEMAVTAARSRLEQQLVSLEERGKRAAAMDAEQVSVTEQLAQARVEMTRLEADLAALAKQAEAAETARERLNAWRGERQLLAQELQQLQQQSREMAEAERQQARQIDSRLAAERAVAELTIQLEAVREANDQLMGVMAERDAMKSEQGRLKESMAKTMERIERLEAEKGGSCPLCGQELSPEHRETVLAELHADGAVMGGRYRDNQARLGEMEETIGGLQKRVLRRAGLERDVAAQQQRLTTAVTQLEDLAPRLASWQSTGAVRLRDVEKLLSDQAEFLVLEGQVRDLESALAGRAELARAHGGILRTISGYEARLVEIGRQVTDWAEEGEAALAAVRAQLAEEAFAAEHRAAMVGLETELAAVGYDTDAHAAALAEREALAKAPSTLQALKQARAAVTMLDENLAELAAQIDGEALHLADLEAQQQAAAARLAVMREEASDLEAVERDVFALREEVVQANRKVGAAEQQLAVLDDLRLQKGGLLERRAGQTQRIARLRLLERACGRDGVQALLIEQALPEIEAHANELLERLTDGQMRVMFDTQRQLKSRDELAETLDIRIVDGVGERPYENFSGGEQFRVNFAIRLALSRLLAQRAGARLRTLVIDEGFGSQDPVGRQRLVEAINTIQGDFGCILVITHIDQLRDAFPTRIQVEKAGGGSMVAVM